MSEEKKIGFIFPGQGAQYEGMGKELCDKFDVARKIFDQANEVLGFDLADICFEGPIEKLTKSAVCQPAILTLSIAALEVFKSQKPEIVPAACAGLSLGEYSALVACGSVKFEDAVRLVNKRGQYMDEASEQNPGTMTCILGLELEAADDICQKAGSEIANLNCPGQIVVSGPKDAIDKTNELAKEAEGMGVNTVAINPNINPAINPTINLGNYFLFIFPFDHIIFSRRRLLEWPACSCRHHH